MGRIPHQCECRQIVMRGRRRGEPLSRLQNGQTKVARAERHLKALPHPVQSEFRARTVGFNGDLRRFRVKSPEALTLA